MGIAWTEAETSALLAVYFAMLELELDGQPYSKVEHNRQVQEQTGRSKGSIEFKFCNISHVLNEAGHAYINGYKPRSHVQESLRSACLNFVARKMPDDTNKGFTTKHLARPLVVSTARTRLPDAPPIVERAVTMENTLPTGSNDLWAFVQNLWDRATGGPDVAARPDQAVDDVWPVASRPPGVEETIAWLRDESNPNGVPRFVFLVGGPGAGKSHATAQAIHGMEPHVEDEDGLAHRIYEFRGQSRDLTIVNDATISGGHEPAPLAADIDRVIQLNVSTAHKTDFMACVNRGIIVEEIGAFSKNALEDQAGEAVVRWISNAPSRESTSGWDLAPKSDKKFIRSAWLRNEGTIEACVVAVFVDECSLFEIRPKTTIDHQALIEATDYSICPIPERPKIPEATTPAGDLLTQVLDTIRSHERTEGIVPDIVDPISANLESLSSPIIRSSFLTIARSSELMNSSRMTYREVWGLFTRACVGNAPSQMNRNELIGFLIDNQPTGQTRALDFKRLQKLASLRITQGLFGAVEEILPEGDYSNDPVLRYMARVDPIRDALPGKLPHNVNAGWTTPISDAFAAHSSEGTPLQLLLKEAPDDQFKLVVTSFDETLDTAYKNLFEENNLKDAERLALISWYSAYLHRLYALAYGVFAFRREISTLVQIHRQAPYLPDHVELPLQTLLRPKRNPDDSINESLLPLFDSRTDPLTGKLAEPKLAIRVDQLELRTVATQGEQIALKIQKGGEVMGRMTLDFALVKEALACVDDRAGVTNLVDTAAPRLERVRASRLLSDRLTGAEIRIVNGHNGHQISQKTGIES